MSDNESDESECSFLPLFVEEEVLPIPWSTGLCEILRLDIDCLEEIFEWLSMTELHRLRQTCKRLKQVVDFYIREYCPAAKIGYMKLDEYNINKFVELSSDHIKLIKQINFRSHYKLHEDVINRIKDTRIERVWLRKGHFWNDFYDSFLQFCPHLKYLSIVKISSGLLIGSGNEWLLRQYPSLEHISLDNISFTNPRGANEVTELQTFFELNPQIHTFTTTSDVLCAQKNWLERTSAKFDLLIIKCRHYFYTMEVFCDLVKKLHRRGYYKRLHCYYVQIYDQNNRECMMSLPALEKLHLRSSRVSLDGHLPECMKEIGIEYFKYIYNTEALANNLSNVERIYIHYNGFDVNDILPFFSQSPKLKHICLKNFERVINVSLLNKAREQLKDACKLTVYAGEKSYLASKWYGPPKKCDLVQIKRAEAWPWENQFPER